MKKTKRKMLTGDGRPLLPRKPIQPQTWCQKMYARQLGNKLNEPRGATTRRIYSHMNKTPKPFPADQNTSHGGIFNFSFSDDGRTLVAATERKKILVLDPLSHKLVHTVADAHGDCVNFVRFLDTRVIASCSDDTSVKLWDVRSLRMPVNDLRGHEGWVKNIEFSKNNGLLLTSGFDGNIQKWDINKLHEPYDAQENRLWRQSGLMRMRLVPDESKMIICTTDGNLIVVHDLDLNTFKEDLSKFQRTDRHRHLHREPASGFVNLSYEDCIEMAKATRNRVEFITDYPFGHKAEVISSLQVHPKGWSVLSRHTTYESSGEWTCVHDIQELDRTIPQTVLDEHDYPKRKRPHGRDHSESTEEPLSRRRRLASFNMRVIHSARVHDANSNGSNSDSEESSDSGVRIFEISTRNADNVPRVEVRHPRPHELPFFGNNSAAHEQRMFFLNPAESRRLHHLHHLHHHTLYPFYEEPPVAKYSKPRLMYYLEEPNVGRGFIKELCFSPDGRIVCSPYHAGVRLFAFDDSCSELADCVPHKPRKLTQISTSQCGASTVVSSKFSPTQHLLVTGCLKGIVNFYQPKF